MSPCKRLNKLLIFSCTVFILPFSACTDLLDEEMKKNKETVRFYIEEKWNRFDTTGLDTLIARNGTWSLGAEERPWGLEKEKAALMLWKKHYPGLNHTIEHIFAEGDRVVVRLTYARPPFDTVNLSRKARKKMKINEMKIFRLKNSRIIEMWSEYDTYKVIEKKEMEE